MVVVVLPATTVAESLIAAQLATFNPGLKNGKLIGDYLAETVVNRFGDTLQTKPAPRVGRFRMSS
jgi:hypothetical protein